MTDPPADHEDREKRVPRSEGDHEYHFLHHAHSCREFAGINDGSYNRRIVGTLHIFAKPSFEQARCPMSYQAFLSYSQLDLEFAKGLQSSLEGFNKPAFRSRSMRIFRDDSNLDASPNLWGGITGALDLSSHLILLASPDSANSKWVQKEFIHFLTDHPLSSICVVVARGKIPWLDEHTQFGATDCAISAEVHGLLQDEFEEPLVIDLRRYRTKSGRLDRTAADFQNVIASLSAWILGREKDQVFGEHLARQHHFRRVLTGGAGVFAVLVALAGFQAWRAVEHGERVVALESEQTQLQKRLREIANVRDQLQQKLDEEQQKLDDERQRGAALISGIQVSTDFPRQSARRNQETLALADTLQSLLKRFNVDFTEAELSEVETLEIRLTKATLKNFQLFRDLTSDEIGLNELALSIQEKAGESAAPFFMEMLSSDDSAQRLAAVDGLIALNNRPKWEPNESEVETILALTRDKHAKVAWSAIELVDALGSIVARNRLEETLRYLMKNGASEYVRDKARRMLKPRGLLEDFD